jgi:hypothetical protein
MNEQAEHGSEVVSPCAFSRLNVSGFADSSKISTIGEALADVLDIMGRAYLGLEDKV